jgi:hypothetical protein
MRVEASISVRGSERDERERGEGRRQLATEKTEEAEKT